MRICLVSEEEEGWGGIGTYTAVLSRALRDLGHTVHVVLRDWEADRREQLDGVSVHRLTVPEPSWRRGTERIVSRLYSAREALLWSLRVSRCVRAISASEGLDVVETPEYRGAGALLGLGALAPAVARTPVAVARTTVAVARTPVAVARTPMATGRSPGQAPCGVPERSAGRSARRPPPLVVRLHTPAFLTERANEQRDERLDRRAVELLERLAVRRADLLTAPSEAVAHAVAERWRLSLRRVAVVPNPIDDELFGPGDAVTSSPVPTVVLVGRLERVKGVDVLVEALPKLLARHPHVQLRLVGEDDPHGHDDGSMAAHLRERARALGVPDAALDIHGAVPREALPALLREAAVCVVPSRWENLPYACVEAMACGRPVVASRVGGLSEAIADGRDGLLVPPGDPRALAAAIARLLENAALAERIGAAARATVERRFAARAVAERMAALYETTRRACV